MSDLFGRTGEKSDGESSASDCAFHGKSPATLDLARFTTLTCNAATSGVDPALQARLPQRVRLQVGGFQALVRTGLEFVCFTAVPLL